MRRPRNKFEAKIENQLIRSNLEFGYEIDSIPYTYEGSYIPDFRVRNIRGHTFYVECKGYFRAGDKRKLVAVRRCHPHLDIRMVFYARDEKSIKWAIKHRFPYAIWEIPSEWFHSETPAKPAREEWLRWTI